MSEPAVQVWGERIFIYSEEWRGGHATTCGLTIIKRSSVTRVTFEYIDDLRTYGDLYIVSDTTFRLTVSRGHADRVFTAVFAPFPPAALRALSPDAFSAAYEAYCKEHVTWPSTSQAIR